MNLRRRAFLFFSAAIAFAGAAWAGPPPTRRDDVHELHFGVDVQDPYRWLEKDTDPIVQAWVSSQTLYATTYLNALPDRAHWVERSKALLALSVPSIPKPGGNRYFFLKTLPPEPLSVLMVREKNGAERTLADPNMETPAAVIGEIYPSPDGQRIAVARHPRNGARGTIQILSLAQPAAPSDELPWTDWADFSWAPDGRGFFYTRVASATADGAALVSNADVAFHRVGSDPTNDPRIFPPSGEADVYLTPTVSSDGKWVFVTAQRGWTGAVIAARPLANTEAAFTTVFNSDHARAQMDAWNGRFYLWTNRDAPNGTVLSAPAALPAVWKTCIAERPNVVLDEFDLLGSRLMLTVVKDGASLLEIHRLDGKMERAVASPILGTFSDLHGTAAGDDAVVSFESVLIPPCIEKLFVSNGALTPWDKTPVHVTDRPIRIERKTIRADDGTTIMAIVARPVDAAPNAPVVISGYGGFGVALTPYFQAVAIPLLESDVTWVLPQLRGGGERGEAWHQAGTRRHRPNVYADLIAVATAFEGNSHRSIGLVGASNGGLLVAAGVTERPDLFRAAVAIVPITDMIRYPLFGEGATWISEYGSPENAEEFGTLFAHSPYHRVTQGTTYPSILIVSSDADERVDPMHARKFAAALQASRSPNPVLLSTRLDAGHGGTGRLDRQADELGDRVAFLLHELGVTK